MTQQRTPGTRWLGATLALALLLPCLFAAPAAGDAIGDKKAEAARITKQVQAQSERVAIAAENYNEAALKAESVTTALSKAKTQIAATDTQADEVRNRLKTQAVVAYMHGGSAQKLGLLIGKAGDTNQMGIRQQYVEAVTGNTKEVLDELRAVRMQLDEQQTELNAAKQDAQSAVQLADTARRAAAKAQAELRTTLDHVQGELSTLVAAEEKRKAAEDARRMQAALAARRAAEAAAAQARAPKPSSRSASGTAASGGASNLPPASGADAAVAEAKRQLGKPYHYGAAGPDSFDCSGLTSWAWAHAGKSLPHSSRAQWSATTRVSIDAIQPGDIVFFGSPIHHVGIYVGNGQMIHAPESGNVVSYEGIYRSDLVGAGRVN